MDNQSPLQGSPRQPAVTVGEDEFLMPGHVLSVASQQSVSANVPAFEQLGMSPALFAGFAGAYSDVHGKPKGSCSSCAGETPTVHPSAIEPPPIMRAVRPEVTPQQARQVEHPPQMRPTREHVGGQLLTLGDMLSGMQQQLETRTPVMPNEHVGGRHFTIGEVTGGSGHAHQEQTSASPKTAFLGNVLGNPADTLKNYGKQLPEYVPPYESPMIDEGAAGLPSGILQHVENKSAFDYKNTPGMWHDAVDVYGSSLGKSSCDDWKGTRFITGFDVVELDVAEHNNERHKFKDELARHVTQLRNDIVFWKENQINRIDQAIDSRLKTLLDAVKKISDIARECATDNEMADWTADAILTALGFVPGPVGATATAASIIKSLIGLVDTIDSSHSQLEAKLDQELSALLSFSEQRELLKKRINEIAAHYSTKIDTLVESLTTGLTLVRNEKLIRYEKTLKRRIYQTPVGNATPCKP